MTRFQLRDWEQIHARLSTSGCKRPICGSAIGNRRCQCGLQVCHGHFELRGWEELRPRLSTSGCKRLICGSAIGNRRCRCGPQVRHGHFQLRGWEQLRPRLSTSGCKRPICGSAIGNRRCQCGPQVRHGPVSAETLKRALQTADLRQAEFHAALPGSRSVEVCRFATRLLTNWHIPPPGERRCTWCGRHA